MVIAKRKFLAAKAAVKRAKAKFRQARKTAKRLKKLLRVAKQNAPGKPKGKARNERRTAKLKAGSKLPHAAKPTKRKASLARLSTRKTSSSVARVRPVIAPKPSEQRTAHTAPISTKSKVTVTTPSRRRPGPSRPAVTEASQALIVGPPSETKEATPTVATLPAPAE